MKRILLALLLLSPLMFASEQIELLCDYVTKNDIGEDNKWNLSSTIHFADDSVMLKIDLNNQKLILNNDRTGYYTYQRGKEIIFTTKIRYPFWKNDTSSNEVKELEETQFYKKLGRWEDGIIDRETGLMNVKNFTEQGKGKGDFKLGFSKVYQCKSSKLLF